MTKVEPRTLPGFMELSPSDQIQFNRLKKIIEDTYSSYGFWPLDTPVIEHANVLLAKAGGETEKQIYRFNKGDNDIALRFDLTVPLAKYVASRSNELVFPFKRYQIGKVYRGERPQKGRFREFYQCDIDVIGDGELSLLYDAEIPSIIYDVFTKMNIGEFVIRINNRKLLNGFFESLSLTDRATDILRIIDKIEKIGKDETISWLKEENISEKNINTIIDFININGNNNEIIESLKKLNIKNESFNNGIYEIETVINNLRSMSIPEKNFNIDLTIARGLDYYTGTVYETKLVDYPSIGSVCSGGRFENLAEYYTDRKLPGVGISIGLTRLFYQLKEAGILSDENNSCADVIVLPMSENYDYILKASNLIRKCNLRVNTCYTDNKFKSKMKYANNCNCKYAVIIGDDEVNNETITIKNMVSGNQEQIKITEIEKYFNK